MYAVHFDGVLIVANSRDPECDLARALLARGISGKVKVIDEITGAHRSTVNIEKAARLSVKEGPLRFVPYESRPERSPAAEDDEAGA